MSMLSSAIKSFQLITVKTSINSRLSTEATSLKWPQFFVVADSPYTYSRSYTTLHNGCFLLLPRWPLWKGSTDLRKCMEISLENLYEWMSGLKVLRKWSKLYLCLFRQLCVTLQLRLCYCYQNYEMENKKSYGDQTLLLWVNFLLFQEMCIAANHVIKNDLF